MRAKAKLPLFLCGLILAALVALSACGKEEKATPTAKTAPPTAAATTAAPGATAAPTSAVATPAAQTPQASGSPAAKPLALPSGLKGHNSVLQDFIGKYHPNLMPAETSDPAYGGEFVSAGPPPAHWDFIRSAEVGTYVGPLIYSSLVRYAINWGDDLFVLKRNKPDMAESWQQAGDGLSWTFKIRQGMRWQNRPPVNGRAITTDDIKYGLDKLRLESPIKNDLQEIERIDVVDPATIKVVLKRPFPDLVDALAHVYSMIGPKECMDDTECARNKPVGAGAFMLDEWKPGVSVSFVKNPNYYGKDKAGRSLPYLNKLTAMVIADPAAQTAAFRTGKIATLGITTPEQLVDIQKTNPNTWVMADGPNFEHTLSGAQVHYNFRKEGAPWQDKRVRQAISMAIDREGQIKGAYGNLAVPMQPVPFYQLGYDYYLATSQLPDTFKYNPEKAKQLLAEAGYAKGFKIKIYNGMTSGANLNATLLIQQNLRAVGIEAEIEPAADSASHNSVWVGGKWEDAIAGYFPPFWSRPDLGPYNVLHSGGQANYEGWKDPVMDDLLERYRYSLDSGERQRLLKQVFEREADQMHMLYGAVPLKTKIAHDWVRNLGSGSCCASPFASGSRTLIETWVRPH